SAVERPEPHVGTPLETVDERLHVSRAEALEEHALLVGLAIAVAIRRVEDHGSLRDDDAALVARDAGRPVQVIDEDARSIEAAVAVGVLEEANPAVRLLLRLVAARHVPFLEREGIVAH